MSAKMKSAAQRSEAPAAPPISRGALYGTVACEGAAVMVVEIVGTRVIGPVFGVSIFVWSALIAVTLCSLAIGYYSGGALADRRPSPGLLGWVFLAAAVCLGLAVLVQRGVLSLALSSGVRVGPLVSATILFAPTLISLGMTGPISVRLATTDLKLTGHGVGAVFAISTAGSLLSTLLVTFYLVSAFETNTILLGTAGLLALLAALWFAGAKRYAGVAVAAALLVLVGLPYSPRTLPSNLQVVARAQSPYSLLEVIDDSERGVRVLRADHSIIGGHHFEDESRIFIYVSRLDALRVLRPRATRMLQIGLGAGTLVRSMEAHGISTDVVEIDPDVVAMARQYFGLSVKGTIHVEDARTFINTTTEKYHLIVHDSFTGGAAPTHLFSVEVLQRIKALMHQDGIVALVLPGYDSGPHAQATWAVMRTFRAVFPHVRAFRDLPQTPDTGDLANLLFFASQAPLDFESRGVPLSADDREVLSELLSLELHVPDDQSRPITDARNQLAMAQLPIAEEHFYAMGKLFPTEVWLP